MSSNLIPQIKCKIKKSKSILNFNEMDMLNNKYNFLRKRNKKKNKGNNVEYESTLKMNSSKLSKFPDEKKIIERLNYQTYFSGTKKLIPKEISSLSRISKGNSKFIDKELTQISKIKSNKVNDLGDLDVSQIKKIKDNLIRKQTINNDRIKTNKIKNKLNKG